MTRVFAARRDRLIDITSRLADVLRLEEAADSGAADGKNSRVIVVPAETARAAALFLVRLLRWRLRTAEDVGPEIYFELIPPAS